MKPTILVLLAALFLTAIQSTVIAEADPLQNFSVNSVAGARKLHAALAGTVWIYHYDGKDYTFRFGKLGEIEALKEWSDVKWRVVSPSEVILDRPSGDIILLRFDPSFTNFKCKDWTGPSATGTRTGKIRS